MGDRQMLIERIYDACEFPHCARNVYGNIYYGIANSLNMETEEFKAFFPEILSPMYHGYKLNQEKCAELSADILEKANLKLLEGVAEYVEYYANLEYPSDFDEGYDSF
jgi:hypothetical protein